MLRLLLTRWVFHRGMYTKVKMYDLIAPDCGDKDEMEGG